MRRGVTIALLSALSAAAAGDLPPRSLIQENVRKADAIVAGTIAGTDMPRGGFAATTLKIVKSYRGPLHPGDTIVYRSFKEEAQVPKAFLEHGVMVFLVNKPGADGKPAWGTAIDFSEFENTPQLEKLVLTLLRKSKK